jgi:hypothetical protein
MMVNQDEEHVKLLSMFHYVLSGLVALFSCMFFIHIVMGIALLCGTFTPRDPHPDEIMGWILIVMGTAFVLFGWTLAVFILIAARKLARHRSWVFCLVVAGAECLAMPLGTILGVFTFVVLMRESVKQMFLDIPLARPVQ